MKQPRKLALERMDSLYIEGWKIESFASVFINDAKDEVAVVLPDGRFFRGALVDEP